MIRLFAAIALPDAVAEGLARVQQGLAGAKWRPLGSLHVTLRFFGEINEARAYDLDAEVSTISGAPFDLALAGVGSFGDGEAIHAVWAGVEATERLRRLAVRMETAARRAGLKAETRAFRPHVTLAHLRYPEPARVAAWIQSHNLLKSPAFTVDRFSLYSSWRGGEGSVYRLERDYRLG